MNIILLEENKLTELGLSHVISNLSQPAKIINTFISFDTLNKYLKSDECNFDALIMEPKGYQYSLSQGLQLIKTFKKVMPYPKRLILLTQARISPLSHIITNKIISKTLPIKKLKVTLEHALFHPDHQFNSSNHTLLTTTEQQILLSLLIGDSPYRIASHRKCSHKTISAHKMNALNKLNIPSLSTLLYQIME